MIPEDRGSHTGFFKEFWSFLKAFASDWIAGLSGVASVTLSILAASRSQILPNQAFWSAAAICFLISSFRVWVKEHRLLEERPPSFQVHGIPTFAVYGKNSDERYLVLPDVTITNPARNNTVSIGVELWIKMKHGGIAYCAAETSPLSDWETSRNNFSNPHLSFPLNLPPQHTENGYIACSLQQGIAYERPVDPDNGVAYFSCRVDFKDYLTNPVEVVHQEEIRFYILHCGSDEGYE